MLAAKPVRLFLDSDALFARLKGERHAALAVSGGSDSMALLRLAALWSQGRVKLTVLTVDHGLRREAAAEAEQVASWCLALSIDHHSLPWTGQKPATGVQAKARKARYDLMAAWCIAHDAQWLVTGHTQDDQAETVAMRQQRTSTVESLSGIWETMSWDGINVLRPLLGQRREDLRSFLNSVGQPWLDDPSNEDERFERVRVRKALKADSIVELAQIAVAAGQAARALEHAARTWLEGKLTIFPEGYGRLPRADFCALEAQLRIRVLHQLIQLFGAGSRVLPSELDHIAGWLLKGQLSRRTLGGAVIAGRQETLLLGREAGRISAVPVIVPQSGETLWDGRFAITAPCGSSVVPAGQRKDLARLAGIPVFVQASLPAVLLPAGGFVVPQLGLGQAAYSKFMRCLR